MAEINKKELHHLAKLARVELRESEEEKLLKDIQEIVGYVAELQSVNTENVPPMNGGTGLQNVFREDGGEPSFKDTDKIRAAFPEKDNGYLKVPRVLGEDSNK